MSESILLAALWGVAANILAMVPSRDNHWSRAYLLIACGIPILGFVTMQHGPVVGLIVLLGACPSCAGRLSTWVAGSGRDWTKAAGAWICFCSSVFLSLRVSWWR